MTNVTGQKMLGIVHIQETAQFVFVKVDIWNLKEDASKLTNMWAMNAKLTFNAVEQKMPVFVVKTRLVYVRKDL